MIKGAINFILNLIMSFLVLGLIFIIIISNTLFEKEFIKQQLYKNNFYERAYSDINEDFENYTMQSGLELDILEGLFPKDKVLKDINKKIDSIYSGDEITIETDSIINELDSRINDALSKNNRIPSESEKSSINKYEDVLRQSYVEGILYGTNLKINTEYFKTARIICISGIIIITIILVVINRSLLKYISCVGINLLFSGILCISGKIAVYKKIQNILLLDSKFSKFLVSSLNAIVQKFYNFGIVAVSIGLALIILGSLEKIQKTIENKKD